MRFDISSTLLAIVPLLGAALCAAQANPASPGGRDDGFQTLQEITLEDEPWSNRLVPTAGPPRGGKPTVALRWQVDQQPTPDSPSLLADWTNVDAVRFWLHLDKAYPFKLNVLLTGSPGGYFMTAVPLDFTGWKQFTIPIGQFTKVREADLTSTRRLAFRVQGYGQPALEKDTVWWVDQVEAKPKAGAKLPAINSLDENLAAWRKLAAQGNPFLLLNARRFERKMEPFKPPAEIKSAWQYRGVAQDLVALAYAVADKASPHRGRADLVEHALAMTDWLVTSCHDEGWWWKSGPLVGDANVNRFTLGPLLDAIRWLRMLPQGEAAWPRWQTKLAAAVDLQRQAYRGEVAWDWGGLAGGEYANQDAYFCLIMALSAELFKLPADRAVATGMAKQIASNLLPDGGIHYISVDNEAPVYHALNLVILGRYATLTGDAEIVQLLKSTANYWPLVLTAEGQPEYWSDVWWKQTWGYVAREGVVIAAGATGDARNQWLMWRALERSVPNDSGMDGIYAAPYWTSLAPGQAMAERFVTSDANMRGIRGRAGSWYFGVTQGRGLRNTFTGGLMTSASHTNPLRAAFRGAHIEVLQDPPREHGLWLSQFEDNTGIALRPDVAGAVGARYTLQPSLINGIPAPATPASPWQVTQIWRAAGDGVIGLVVLEATAETAGTAVVGRIALGPGPVEKDESGLWRCGPLRVKLLRQFGEASVQPVPGYNQTRDRAWHGIEWRQPIEGKAARGARFVYAAWIGPQDARPPDDFKPLPDDRGWVASWTKGATVAALFNPTGTAVTVRVPWAGAPPDAWIGDIGSGQPVRVQNGAASVRLEAGGCALMER